MSKGRADLQNIEIIVRALDAKKGGDIVVLDLQQQSSYLSYFVIVTALSKAHLKSLFDEIHQTAVDNNIERPRPQSPQFESGWVTYDFGFYVIHLFEEEKRKFYNLEGIWKLATRIDLPGSRAELSTKRSTDLTPRKGETKSVQAPKKSVSKKTEKTSAKSESFSKKKTTIKKKTIKEIKMATAKKKPAKKKAAKKPAKKKAAKKK